VDDLYVDEGMCFMECGCVCVCGMGLFGGRWCSLRQFEGHNGKGRKCVLRVCHFLLRGWHVPLFPISGFPHFSFRILCWSSPISDCQYQ
jgi:hypothetical protein